MFINKKSKLTNIILITVLSIIMSYIFWVVHKSTGDDAATYKLYYKLYDLGYNRASMKNFWDPWMLISLCVYKFGLFNIGFDIPGITHTILYFLCIWLTFYIVSLNGRVEYLFLAAYILLPNCRTNGTHQASMLVVYLLIILFDIFQKKKNKAAVISCIAILLYSLLFFADRALLAIYIVLPFCIYTMLKFVQNNQKAKMTMIKIVLAFSICLMAVRLADIATQVLYDWSLIEKMSFGGYGDSDYASWGSFEDIWIHCIPQFFTKLFEQFSVSPKGGLLQFDSIFWGIRIVLVVFLLYSYFYYLIKIIKKGINSISFVNAISVLIITVVSVINIMNGILVWYPTDNSPVLRYAGVIVNLLVILGCNCMKEKIDVVKNLQYIVNGNERYICIMLVALLVANTGNVYLGRKHVTKELGYEYAQYLSDSNNAYECGLAGLRIAQTIGANTNMKIFGTYGEVNEDGVHIQDKGWSDDKTNIFNYILIDGSHSGKIEEEYVEEYRPDFADKSYIYADDGEGIVYFYDYDIRWAPKELVQVVGDEYEITEPLTYYMDFNVGVNRIEITSSTPDNISVTVDEMPEISNAEIKQVNNKVYVELTCNNKVTATVNVSEKTQNEIATFARIETKIVKGALQLDQENFDGKNGSLSLKEGKYVITFAGENINKANIDWQLNGAVQQLSNGKVKSRYEVYLSEPQTITFTINSENSKIETVSYEMVDTEEE